MDHHRTRTPLHVTVLAVVAVLSACTAAYTTSVPDPQRPVGMPEVNSPAVRTGSFDPAQARFWTWDEPLGVAAELPQVIQMVRPHVHEIDGRAAANKVCDMIVQRGLRPGQVCICLQGFGEGGGDPEGKSYHVRGRSPLFFDWNDGLRRSDTEYWWYTPWMKNGRARTSTWMNNFIAQYKARQRIDHRIPDPSRFAFDTERYVVVNWQAKAAIESFHSMMRDARWSTEKLPGYNKTMSELYEDAGRPKYDHRQEWYRPVNQEWAVWYHGLCIELADAAMNEVAYEPIRNAWIGCMSSNYRSATSFDGEDDRYDVDALNPWLKTVHKSYADQLAPVTYRTVERQGRQVITRSSGASTVVMERRLQAMVESYGGIDPARITPWIELTGTRRKPQGRDVLQSVQATYLLVHALGNLGVQEFLVWSNDSSRSDRRYWDAFAGIVLGELPPSVDPGH
ncbi:MAG: hypothetical protein AAF432_14345 [Planctomycetota bacterium]